MTVTESPQKPADTTRTPLSVTQIDPVAMYDALRRLTRTTALVLADVDKNSVELHKDLDALRAAHAAANDLFFPPPLPEAPENVEVLYAHAVRPGDQVFMRGEWVTVADSFTAGSLGRLEIRSIDPTVPVVRFEPSDVLPVRRAKKAEASE